MHLIRFAFVLALVLAGHAGLTMTEPVAVEPEIYPFDYVGSPEYEEGETRRLETIKMEFFSPDGHWLVETDIDHNAHWKHQMEVLYDRSSKPVHLGDEGCGSTNR